jgi:hypothetical protein
VLLAASGTSAGLADDMPAEPPLPEPPLVGRPAFAPFSDAVGSFRVSTRAEPTTLEAEDPLTFTVRVTADRAPVQPPQRPDLREVPGFEEHFFIEDRTDRDTADDGDWHFIYRLRPRSPAVRAVPSFPLVYYHPGIEPPEKGYMTRWADAIPLTVTPRRAVRPSDLVSTTPLPDLPEAATAFVDDPAALARSETDGWPSPGLFGVLVLGPPMGCAVWYAVWRRLRPDAQRQARHRQSRAARLALRRLHSLDTGDDAAGRVEAAVADYLRQRVPLQAAEPTPVEIAAAMRQASLPGGLIDHAVRFFQQADASRFHPSSPAMPALRDAAVDLVNTLEAEPWAH